MHRPTVMVVSKIRGAAGSPERARVLERLAAAAAAGAIIQVRDRTVSDRDLLAFTRELVDRTRESGPCVLVNDRVDIALAAGALGAHLRSDGPPGTDVRRLVPPGFVLGRSIHSQGEAAASSAETAYDYLLFGTVFRSDSKPDGPEPAGLDRLRVACAAATIPVLAIGGIDLDRAPDVARAGAAGIAAISLFASAADIEATVHAAREALTLHDGVL